jgi:hypothetical protein
MKTLKIKAIIKDKSPGTLILSTSGHFDELKNKILNGCENKPVFLTIEDEKKYKTNLQNNLFHKLIEIYFYSNQHDYSMYFGRAMKDRAELKTDVKIRLGCGIEQIPDGKLNGELINNKTAYLKSWQIYTITEARKTLDMLMLEMNEKGIETNQERLMFNELYKKKKDIPIF